MAVSYGELATCPIADFSDLFAEEKQNPVSGEDAAQIFTENTNSVPAEHAKATAGQKIFFVVTKTLELMAIPLLAVV
ncbi:MAG: hypothetical protein LBT98_01095, partial [Puniceicoccales bacterium]|nr:hypothetical protein [Puniceicoccales bacterium]